MSALVFTEEDADLLARVRAGDTRAEDEAIRKWESYVWRVCRAWYTQGGVEWEELEAQLRVSLLLACRGWRPDREAQFPTYMHRTLTNMASKYTQRWRRAGITDTQGEFFHLLSLNAPIVDLDPHTEHGERQDAIPDPLDLEGDVVHAAAHDVVHRRVRALPDPLQRAVTLRFGFEDGVERTQSEVAAIIGVTQMSVSRWLRQAFRILAQDPEIRALWEG